MGGVWRGSCAVFGSDALRGLQDARTNNRFDVSDCRFGVVGTVSPRSWCQGGTYLVLQGFSFIVDATPRFVGVASTSTLKEAHCCG